MSSVIALVGIPAAGKSTLCRSATLEFLNVSKLISATTRPPRATENNGVDKHFLTQAEFDAQVASGELCLVNETYGYQYAFRTRDLKSDETFITELHYKNLSRFLEYCPGLVSICVSPKVLDLAFEGIGTRGETSHEVEARKKHLRAEHERLIELTKLGQFDYHFVNNFDDASKMRFKRLLDRILADGQ